MTENNKKEFDPIAWANAKNEKEVQQPQIPTSSSQPLLMGTSAESDDLATQVRDLTAIITGRGIDITTGYSNWLNLGFGLVDGLGEGGREYYHELSRMNEDYNPTECDKQYDACLKSHGQGITISTFFYMARCAGIDMSQFAIDHMQRLTPAEDFSHILTPQISATSAIAPNANNTEKVGKSSVSGVLDSGMADGSLAEVAETTASCGNGYTFSDKLNGDALVGSTRKLFDMYKDDPVKCDAQLLSKLNITSGMMGMTNGTDGERSGIYGIYDSRRVYANLYNLIFGGAGMDKGSLRFCKYLLHHIRCEIKRRYEAEKDVYEREMAEWEAKNKKERGVPPKEPTFRDPFVPGNSSSSAVYRAMDANGGYGLMFETEADTISSMIDSDYGNYSDLMRKAHHHEPVSMNRVTEKVHIDIEEPRLSIFLTCTPGQLPALFPSFENGLGSRFLFYNLPDEEVDFHDVFVMTDTPLEDIYKDMGKELLPLYHALLARKGHPIQFVMSQSQQREFISTYSGVLKEQFKMLGKGIRAFVFRMALECFRYAMILTTLRRLSERQDSFNPSDPEQPSIFRDDENALVCDDRDFHTAMTIIGCLINHTARVYAVMAKEDDNPFAQKGIKLTADEIKVYNALPEGDFRTVDFIEVAASMNIAERTAQRMLGNFCNKYRIVNPIKRGVYSKPKRKEE